MMRAFLIYCLTLVLILSVFHGKGQLPYHEKYRPQFHFSPLKGWTGDPDGLVKYQDVYHLFWWGHAISKDLVHWKEMPYPIKGNVNKDGINSGGAVIDTLNVAGFGKNAMIAFHSIENKEQTVGISSSLDYTYLQLYPRNPILRNFGSGHDFRDPHVFWHALSKRWIMIVALGLERKLAFYESTDLKSWTYLSSFGPDGGEISDNWETPDIFLLPLDGNKENQKYVLTIAAGTDKMQYFVGWFDGKKFINEQSGQYLQVDFGKDFYAAQTWRDFDEPQKSIIMMGWLGSWDYSPRAPSKETYGGQGVESLPRELSLVTYPEGIRLRQSPIEELKKLRGPGSRLSNTKLSGVQELSGLTSYKNLQNTYEIDLTFGINRTSVIGLNLLVDDKTGRKLILEFNAKDSVLSVDRRNTTDADFCCKFDVITGTRVSPENGQLRLHIYVDQSSVEIFVNDGKLVCSMLTYPSESQTGIELFSKMGEGELKEFEIWPLRSIW